MHVENRLTTSVPVSASFIELDAATTLHRVVVVVAIVVAIVSLSKSETTTIFVSLRRKSALFFSTKYCGISVMYPTHSLLSWLLLGIILSYILVI